MATLRPLNGRLVVKRSTAVTTTAAGIVIIDADLARPNAGEVLAVAPDVKGVKVGDTVLYDHSVGTELKVDGVTNFVLHVNNLFGVIKANEPAPLSNTILFKFLDATEGAKGAFSERYKGLIVIPTLQNGQTKTDRWGQVVAIGPDVQNIKVGDFVLVAAQQWTRNETWNGEKIWKTVDSDSTVLCVTDREAETIGF